MTECFRHPARRALAGLGATKARPVTIKHQTGLLAALSIGIAIQAIVRIRGGDATVDVSAFAIGVILFSIAVDLVRWRALTYAARTTSSHALSADALHYSSDLVASVLVLLRRRHSPPE